MKNFGLAISKLVEKIRFFVSPLIEERRCYACSSCFIPIKVTSFLFGKDEPDNLFCPKCLNLLLPRISGFCPLCGKLMSWEALLPSLCGNCLLSRPLWDNFIFYGKYYGLLRDMILGIKFRNRFDFAYALGLLLSKHTSFLHLDFDIALPIPLHKKRLVERGYNQSAEILIFLLKFLNKSHTLHLKMLRRKGNNPPQVGLTHDQRRINVEDVFFVSESLEGKHILLFDDVMTTGSTLQSAVKALKEANAKKVTVAVVARTSLL